MERDYGKEIDEIKAMLTELTEAKQQTKAEIKARLKETKQQKKDEVMARVREQRALAQNRHSDKRLQKLQDEMSKKISDKTNGGLVTYMGVFAGGGCQSYWISNQVDTDRLLELIESGVAAKVLACIGNNDRLNMLLALLRAPKTVAQLVEECGYNTTGQVYHHLKPLLAADLIKEDEHGARGTYMIQPHRVQGVIMLLAGISDMLDTKYTQGEWE